MVLVADVFVFTVAGNDYDFVVVLWWAATRAVP